jgi:ribosomal protein S1
MTSKRIKKKKKKTSKFVALLLLFKNREKELYPKTNDIQNTRRVLSRGCTSTKKERERETKRGDDVSCHFTSLSRAKKKIPLSREEKTQQTTSEKEKKKNDKTNRRLTSSS